MRLASSAAASPTGPPPITMSFLVIEGMSDNEFTVSFAVARHKFRAAAFLCYFSKRYAQFFLPAAPATRGEQNPPGSAPSRHARGADHVNIACSERAANGVEYFALCYSLTAAGYAAVRGVTLYKLVLLTCAQQPRSALPADAP